ncbi:MAG: hypothetical protein EPN88_16510 [Bacteroidetes bacterium]|nr:MAG: hypothetical protein EPN88_16510 [Bacteroidota bacterium]
MTDPNTEQGDLISMTTCNSPFRQILGISGYQLRKPIEVLITGHSGTYLAEHILPAVGDNEQGRVVTGFGSTEFRATKDLVEKLLGLYGDIADVPIETLGSELQLQRAYLDTIMIKFRYEHE